MGQPQPILYAVRHGQTILNAQDAYRGPTNVPLDATGWRQANKLKEYFSGQDFSYAFSSDKTRATDTVDKILEGRELKPIIHAGLRALDVGDLGGKPKTPESVEVVKYHFEHQDIPMPGGESFSGFKARVNPLILDAINLGLENENPVLLVVHSSIIHEIGTIIGGHHEYTLVEPGGVAAIFIKDGKLDAEPVYRKKEGGSMDRPNIIT
jgi:broad specificity phosphatase PhoE